MADIRNVFNGPFAHKHGHNYQWTEYTGKIPYPRPGTVGFCHVMSKMTQWNKTQMLKFKSKGSHQMMHTKSPLLFFSTQCPGGTFTPGIRSSKNFSDEAVNFIRAHPLMFHSVYPIHRRPLVVRTGVDYRYTALVVDQVDAVDGRYEVLFLGTGETTSGMIAHARLKLISFFFFMQMLFLIIIHSYF